MECEESIMVDGSKVIGDVYSLADTRYPGAVLRKVVAEHDDRAGAVALTRRQADALLYAVGQIANIAAGDLCEKRPENRNKWRVVVVLTAFAVLGLDNQDDVFWDFYDAAPEDGYRLASEVTAVNFLSLILGAFMLPD